MFILSETVLFEVLDKSNLVTRALFSFKLDSILYF